MEGIDNEESSPRNLSAADKKMLERHSELYERLLKCTDVNEYKEIYREYAELDMKVARLQLNDKSAIMRCEYENNFSIAK